MGQGTYGEIYSASVKKIGSGRQRGKTVAVKRLFVLEQSSFAFSYREMDICLKLANHPNICGSEAMLYSSSFEWPSLPPEGVRDDSIILLMPLAKGDLCHLCEAEVLSEVKIKRITAQILLALEYMHNNGYIHRDIKPTNILHYDAGIVKLCDFGLSKRYFPYDEHSSLAASDYFRAPEALCLVPTYGYPLDIWSLGCTVHYLHCNNMPCPEWDIKNGPYTRIAQVQAIIDSLPYEVSPDTLADDPINRHLKYEAKTTSSEFFSAYREDIKSIDELSEFLIQGMLMFDQRHRLTARQLLDHKYMLGVEAKASSSRIKTLLPLSESEPTVLRSSRDCCTGMMNETYRAHCRLEWYRDKVLFTSIAMFDRVLAILFEDHPTLVLDDWNIKTYYRTCLYISAKYYCASISCDLSYKSFPFSELNYEDKTKADDLEKYIASDILQGKVYQVSIYDVATSFRRPRDRDVESLLDFVIRGAHNGLTPQEAYTRWEDQSLIG